MTYLLSCAHLSKKFGAHGEVVALENATLNVSSGEFVTLLGPSGCGKSTTLRLIAGFEKPDSGTITLNKQRVAGDGVFVPPEERRVGMVFQDYALFPHLSVQDNVAFGLSSSRQEKHRHANMILDLVGLDGFGKRLPHELSGGQQQRVALARALAPQPDVILLDEPFSNLDAALRAQVRGEVRSILKETNTTCIFVTHDQEEALSLSDRVAVMFDGLIEQIDTPSMVYRRPATQRVASFVGEGNFLPAAAHGHVAHCILGEIPLMEHAQGEITLLVRPESLDLSADGDDPAGRVLWREFYGHDQRVGVEMESGVQLIARLGAVADFAPGDSVRVRVIHPARAFE